MANLGLEVVLMMSLCCEDERGEMFVIYKGWGVKVFHAAKEARSHWIVIRALNCVKGHLRRERRVFVGSNAKV
jgi:hypothetical protein